MSTTSRTLPPPIPLGASWPRRLPTLLATTLASLLAAVGAFRRRRAATRLERRRAAAQRVFLAQIDARTARDLGLGDWTPSRPDEHALVWRDVELHRF
jgi:hypothetical protein